MWVSRPVKLPPLSVLSDGARERLASQYRHIHIESRGQLPNLYLLSWRQVDIQSLRSEHVYRLVGHHETTPTGVVIILVVLVVLGIIQLGIL